MLKIRFVSITLISVGMSVVGCNANEPLDIYEQESSQTPIVQSAGESSALEEDTTEGFINAGPTDGYEVIFEDDFENSTGIPDPAKWSLCKKAEAHWSVYQAESYDLAYTKDGVLNLVVEEKDGEYLTSGIDTQGKFSFTYGKVEVRARFAKRVMGSHCGIWMMPEPPAETWPRSGEIDIMEYIREQNVVHLTTHSYWIDNMDHGEEGKSFGSFEINKQDWNVYGVEWTEDSLNYTINGKVVMSYSRNKSLEGQDATWQWPFSHPFYLILSHSLGGEDTWAGPIDNSALPGLFQIDWVRVMQPSGVEAGVPYVRN